MKLLLSLCILVAPSTAIAIDHYALSEVLLSNEGYRGRDGDLKANGGTAKDWFQIRPIFERELKRIGIKFSTADCYDLEKSRSAVMAWTRHMAKQNPGWSVAHIAQRYNGGTRSWTKPSAVKYGKAAAIKYAMLTSRKDT